MLSFRCPCPFFTGIRIDVSLCRPVVGFRFVAPRAMVTLDVSTLFRGVAFNGNVAVRASGSRFRRAAPAAFSHH